MNNKWLTFGGLGIAVILLFAVNIVSSNIFQGVRLDMTKNELFTLSDGTRNILAKLQEPVTLRLFLSRKRATDLPIHPHTVRVRELLNEFERAAGGKLRVQHIDPEPFSEDEDRAVGYGLQGFPLEDGESTFYFGAVATGPTDEEVVIPFFSPNREEFFEYDLAKLIYQVAFPDLKVVGLISTLPISGGAQNGPQGINAPPQPAWTVIEQMRQLFEVRDVDVDADEIPDDIDVLMLVHPKNLPAETLYAIDQFALAGGRILVFVDPNAESDYLSGPAGAVASDLGKLFSAWGVQFEPNKVIGDLRLAQKVSYNQEGRPAHIDYPIWMSPTQEQLNEEDVVTAKLGSLNFASAGRLTPLDERTTEFTPLVKTTPAATELDAGEVRFMRDPAALLRNYRAANQSFTLAARVTGTIKSAFPDGPPKAAAEAADPKAASDATAEDKPAAPKHLKESKEPLNAIIVADTDMLQDRFWVHVQPVLRVPIPIAANGAFVINALDNLVGSSDLINVRNRGQFSRPFTRVNQLRQEAEIKFREKEKKLLARLQDTERKLLELEQGKQKDSSLVLNKAQLQEIERFRDEKIEIRKELRQVRHKLDRDIQRLEATVKFANIGLMPLLIGVGGIFIAVQRNKRRNRRKRAVSETPTRS